MVSNQSSEPYDEIDGMLDLSPDEPKGFALMRVEEVQQEEDLGEPEDIDHACSSLASAVSLPPNKPNTSADRVHLPSSVSVSSCNVKASTVSNNPRAWKLPPTYPTKKAPAGAEIESLKSL